MFSLKQQHEKAKSVTSGSQQDHIREVLKFQVLKIILVLILLLFFPLFLVLLLFILKYELFCCIQLGT